MKSEILKLIRNKAFYVLLILTALLSFAVSFIFYFSKNNISDFVYNINEYANKEELLQEIAGNEKSIESLNESYARGEVSKEDYSEQIEALQTTLKIYKYLDENDLNYNDVQPTIGLNSFSDNKVSYSRLFILAFEFFMFAVIIVLSAIIFNYEIGRGIHKFLYNGGKKRLNIVFKKSVVYFAAILFFCAIGISLMLIMSKPFGESFKRLLVVTGGAVKTFSVSRYIGYVILSFFSDILFWSIVIFALSLLIKNANILLSTDIVLIFAVQTGISYIPNNFINAFVQFPILIYDIGITETQLVTATLVKYALAGVLTAVSLLSFSKKDLA
jgi:hypothetical protein